MKIVLDESASARLVLPLRELGHEVVSIAETAQKGMPDEEVWQLACDHQALLITRDYHFTNAIRFDPAMCLGIVFIRHWNLRGSEEVSLVLRYLASPVPEQCMKRLVTLSPHETRIR